MSDVTQIAIEYRQKLLRDVARIDAFLRLAGDLARQADVSSPPPRATLPAAPVAPRPESPAMGPSTTPHSPTQDTRGDDERQFAKEKAGEGRAGLAFRNAFGSREIDLKQRFA